jgi:hypothetical protein
MDVHAIEEYFALSSGVPRDFFGVRGFNKFSSGQKAERTGIWGR